MATLKYCTESDSEEEKEIKVKTYKTKAKQVKKFSNHDTFCEFELGTKGNSRRKVVVNDYKGRRLVDTREYYHEISSGEEKPGKKGIALTVEQWDNLVKQIREIDNAVRS